jgi:hypothetical protein
MSTTRVRRALAVLLAAPLLLTACAEAADEALEPLRGHGVDEPAIAPSADDGELPAEVGGESIEHAALAEGEAPPGFAQGSFDEADLPPDVPPPPIEPGASPAPASPAPAAPAPAAAPAGPPPAQPSTPPPSGGPGGVAAVDDYCTLFRQYGTVMAAVDTAITGGAPQQIAAALRLASEVHDRAAALAPGAQAEHRQIAQALRDFDSLLAAHGYDIRRLIAAAETDAGVGARLQATQVDPSIQRTNQQVLDHCGIALP